MGCGPSSAVKGRGRENYSTLLADQDFAVSPRLDSFIVPQQQPEQQEKSKPPKKKKKEPVVEPTRSEPPKERELKKDDPNEASFSDIASKKATAPFEDSFKDLAARSKPSRTPSRSTPPPRTPSHIPTFKSTQFEDEEELDYGFPSEAVPSYLVPDRKGSLALSLDPPSIADSEANKSSHNPPSVLDPPSLLPPEQNSQKKEEKHKKSKKSKKKRKSKSKSSIMASLEKPEPGSESGMRFDQLYKLKGVLGTGAFSTVREGYHKSSSSHSFAVKCVNRKKLSEEDEAALLDEVSILKEMKHIHIIRLFDFFVEQSTYYLIMERMCGGELFDRIVAKAYYNEKEARDVCKILLEAVGYCHENQVAHRDLKPENLLLLNEEDDSTVKIADFGFAKKVSSPKSLTTQCGTPGYVAPEILEGIPYDTRADMWSVGVILYILLGGYPPFIESNQRDLFRKIRRGDYEFHVEYWGTISKEAKDLISSLLTVDPAARLDAKEALANRWIRGDDDALAQRDLGANLKELTKFNGKRKFRAAVGAVVASNKLLSLGKEFLADD